MAVEWQSASAEDAFFTIDQVLYSICQTRDVISKCVTYMYRYIYIYISLRPTQNTVGRGVRGKTTRSNWKSAAASSSAMCVEISLGLYSIYYISIYLNYRPLAQSISNQGSTDEIYSFRCCVGYSKTHYIIQTISEQTPLYILLVPR